LLVKPAALPQAKLGQAFSLLILHRIYYQSDVPGWIGKRFKSCGVKNTAMKVPDHEYEEAMAFYFEVLGFRKYMNLVLKWVLSQRYPIGQSHRHLLNHQAESLKYPSVGHRPT